MIYRLQPRFFFLIMKSEPTGIVRLFFYEPGHMKSVMSITVHASKISYIYWYVEHDHKQHAYPLA